MVLSCYKRLIESITNKITITYSYDNNGNLLREENINKTTNYIYNKFNKLKQVTKSDGSWMYSHYNAQGLRIGTEESGIYYGFTFERGSIIREVDSNNELISRSIRGYSLIANKDKREVLSYYLHNSHGDITNLVDENGQVLNSYDYDAFGNTLNQVEQVSNRFMYAGEQFDKVTEHYYLRARYYAPNIGRFTQEDTYRGDGLNLYAYVSNNPVMYVDPSGYCKGDIGSKSEDAYNDSIVQAAQIRVEEIIEDRIIYKMGNTFARVTYKEVTAGYIYEDIFQRENDKAEFIETIPKVVDAGISLSKGVEFAKKLV